MSKKITVQQIKDEVKKPTAILISAILAPNGSIMFKGITLGNYKKLKRFIFINKF